MPNWSRRRTRSLAEDVARFVEGLDAHPEIRGRLRRLGYTDQVHRELQACLARMGDGEVEVQFGERGGSLLGSARAVTGWMAEQVTVASVAATKLPDVAAEAADALFGSTEPLEAVRESRRLYRRVRADEHLSHFFTLSGLRDAGAELSQRLQDGGAPAARARRQQDRSELGFLFTRWRQICLQELAHEPALLQALGLDT
jgi:hypothetical protein